jgi:hypothetical protein
MDFLPDVTPAPLPSPILPPDVGLKEKGEYDEKGPPEILRDEINYDEDDDDDAHVVPEVKSILRNDEVFRSVKKKVEISPEPDLVVQPIQGAARPPQLTKKGRAKRQASEKQKEHLKKARVKALETRRRNKKAKDEANGIFDDHPPAPHVPMPAPQSPKPKPEQPPPVPRPEPQPAPEPVFMGYTQDEMNEAVFNGIQRYDGQRKQQKKEKKARLAKEEHDRRVVEQIQKAVGPTHQSDPWSSVFTFN